MSDSTAKHLLLMALLLMTLYAAWNGLAWLIGWK